MSSSLPKSPQNHSHRRTLILWTDGSAAPNPGPGGYAVIDATPVSTHPQKSTPAKTPTTAHSSSLINTPEASTSSTSVKIPVSTSTSPPRPTSTSSPPDASAPRPVRLGSENPSTNIRMEAHALIAAIEYAVSVNSSDQASTHPASTSTESPSAAPSHSSFNSTTSAPSSTFPQSPSSSPTSTQPSSTPLCEIHTDSEFWINVLTKWAPSWRARGWRKSHGEIQNLDLVKKLYHLYTTYPVQLVWTRGHVGTPENELADYWANQARTGATLPD